MTANEPTPRTGQESSGTDSEHFGFGRWPSADEVAQIGGPVVATDGGSTRRTFLGAAAALAGLSASASGEATESPAVDVSTGDMGSGIASVETGGPVWADVELWGGNDREAEFSVHAEWLDDEQPWVHVGVNTGIANITTSMSPDRVRRLARELQTAADRAEQGQREVDQ